jgi:hypothetical protein
MSKVSYGQKQKNVKKLGKMKKNADTCGYI